MTRYLLYRLLSAIPILAVVSLASFLLIFLVIHVSALVLVPRNWPLLKSMVTTRISRDYAKQHLPLWIEDEDGTETR